MDAPSESQNLGHYDAFLFDMDGTILTSIPAVERAWTAWAQRIGLPAGPVLQAMHGRRAIDTIRDFTPASRSVAEELAWLDAYELQDIDGIAPIPGAAAFLRALPPDAWAVVTSANRALALKRIEAAGLPMPRLLVSSDDVRQGKPDPEGYLLACRILGRRPGDCLVFEDTATGLAAGRSAGACVIRIQGQGPQPVTPFDRAIASYDDLDLRLSPRGLELSLRASGAPSSLPRPLKVHGHA